MDVKESETTLRVSVKITNNNKKNKKKKKNDSKSKHVYDEGL